MKVKYVPEDDLGDIWATPVMYTDKYSEDEFDAEWEVLRDALRKNLGKRWKEDCCGDADFAVMDDCGDAWTQCGGLFSERACCPEYVQIVAQTLQESTRPSLWAYHTVIELCDESSLFDSDDSWEFVIKDGVLYLPDDGRDYSWLLKQSL